ncbi:YaaC family protein [Priestia aryabhattai]|uniref:YaaC family protein n=1 Tax=Priestia aryabhattai TaxID=412384 RepID=UPI00203F83DA|nr:YaaC family protein [Priestia aryabhattai]MCM2978988.1 YaaC family protein [Priestia aryabhattai]
MHEVLKVKEKQISIHKTISMPNFGSKTVLVSDPWEYVEMFLKRNSKKKNKHALFFWQQAKQFAEASKILPLTSSPLTNYYSFLNATKTLLIYKGVEFAEEHGVSGNKMNKNVSLTTEIVKLKTSGILPALTRYIEGNSFSEKEDYSLREIFYNLAFIHRAYCLTYDCDDLFLPIKNPQFVKRKDRSDCWMTLKVDAQYTQIHQLNLLPSDFSIDVKEKEEAIVEYKKFKFKDEIGLERLQKNHQKIRLNMQYIYGSSRMWYLKLNPKPSTRHRVIDRNPLTLMYASMHRLSELSRYQPDLLQKHFNSSTHNWLLTEFLRLAPIQFIDSIAAEITGHEFMPPGYVSRN